MNFDVGQIKGWISQDRERCFVFGSLYSRIAIVGKNKEIGILGENHPDVILNWGLENPIVALELNLNELFGMLHSL